MSDETTDQFFLWMEANNLSRAEIAPLLGVDERSLSNYRSRGLPKKKLPLAANIMADWGKPDQNTQNKLNIEFNDEEMNLVEQAAATVGTPLREYMRRAVIARARQDAASSQNRVAS